MNEEPIYYVPEMHWFYRGGKYEGKIPSAGTILNHFYPMRPVPQFYLDRGSVVHDLCHKMDLGVDVTPITPPDFMLFIVAYSTFRAEYRWKMLAAEKKCCHPSGRFSGKLDRVFDRGPGLPQMIADLKLGNNIQERYWLANVCYAMSYDPEHWDQYERGIVCLRKDGIPEVLNDPSPAEHAVRWMSLVDEWWNTVGKGSAA